MTKIKYNDYIDSIKKELLFLGVIDFRAEEKAKSCRGDYVSETEYVPQKKQIERLIKYMDPNFFELDKLMYIKNNYDLDWDYEKTDLGYISAKERRLALCYKCPFSEAVS